MSSSLLAPFLLAAAAASPGYPAPAILSAFTDACGEVGDRGANIAALERSGWKRLPETARNPLSRVIDKVLHGLGSLDSSTEYDAQFRKTVAKRTLYVSLSTTHYGGSMSGTDLDCALFDFEAPRTPSREELSAWSGHKPDQSKNEDGKPLVTYDGGTERPDIRVYFIPRKLGAYNVFTGLRLSATAYKGSR
jgi:hypothetical protein